MKTPAKKEHTKKQRTPQQKIRQFILNLSNIDRVHIVGAARSGTTMLHYAMGAFQNALLCERETSPVWSPSTLESFRIALKNLGSTVLYVTKRNFSWYTPAKIIDLKHEVRSGGLGLIMLVRDPRDALTSRHANAHGQHYYLEIDRWLSSINAGEGLFDSLSDYPRKIIIRYEDLISDPNGTCEKMCRHLNLQLKSEITDFGDLPRSVALAKSRISMETALNRLRAFDPSSIGKWKKFSSDMSYLNNIMENTYYRTSLEKFMSRYRYIE
jgi:hypothetical protein